MVEGVDWYISYFISLMELGIRDWLLGRKLYFIGKIFKKGIGLFNLKGIYLKANKDGYV